MNRYSMNIAGSSFTYFASESLEENLSFDYCSDCYKLVFSLSHGGYLNVEGAEYIIAPGSLLLISPFTCHHVDIASGAECESYTLMFAKSSLSESVLCLLDKLVDCEEIKSLYYPPESINSNISELFRRFKLVNDLSEPEKNLYFQTLLSELIILLSAYKVDGVVPPDDCLGSRVVRYLNNNIERNISLDKLAKRFFVSKYHLCRAFKEYSGISVHSYINHKRIMYAKQLIEFGQTASGAAEKVGFGDYSAFYRAYLKIVGKSPTAE